MNIESTEKWIKGLKFKEKRPFTPEESTEIKRKINKFRIVTWLWIIGYPIGLFLIFLIGNGESSQYRILNIIISIVIIIYIMIVLALVILRSIENLKVIKCLKKDYESGLIEKYEVMTSSTALSNNNFVGGIEVKKYIEVIPEAGLVFRLDGGRPAKTILVEIAKVAKSAENILRVPLQEGFYSLEPNKFYEYNQRHMTNDEIEEIKTKIKAIKRISSGGWLYYGFVAFLILCAILSIFLVGITSFYKKYLPMFFAVTAMTYFGIRTIIRKWRFAKWLEKNIEMGIIIIATKKKSSEPTSEPMNEAVEFLPIANIDWTLDGKPSDWRIYKD
jgi:hypothetical protein